MLSIDGSVHLIFLFGFCASFWKGEGGGAGVVLNMFDGLVVTETWVSLFVLCCISCSV